MSDTKNFKDHFLKGLNFHRRLSVAAALDVAVEFHPDMSVKDLNTTLENLVDKKLVSFSRTHELFYLGDPPEEDAKQQPLPASMVEKLLVETANLKEEVIKLKTKSSD